MSEDFAHLLRGVLADERAALTGGDFAALAAIALRMEEILRRIAAPGPHDLASLRALASDLARQQRLIEASLAGIRAARVRIAALRAAERGTRSYGRDGSSQRIGAETPGFERRA